MSSEPAQFVSPGPEHRVACALCSHHCDLAPGETGVCRVRRNVDGSMELPFYGRATALAVDPIEKKPLYHFHPGGSILSVGFLGCNFRCPFCQNYRISQGDNASTEDLTPDALPDLARAHGSIGVAYTYNEPLIHYEFVLSAARLVRGAGLKNVVVTAGYLETEPAERLLPFIDAVNVDLKSFNREFYRTEVQGRLEPVKRFIELAVKHCHVEVTTLVIPGKNDSAQEIEAIAQYLASLDSGIPLHLSAYYPTYHYTTAATPPELIEERVETARKHLRYVYPGNTAARADTYCSGCNALLVERSGYAVRLHNLHDGRCSQCQAPVPFTY